VWLWHLLVGHTNQLELDELGHVLAQIYERSACSISVFELRNVSPVTFLCTGVDGSVHFQVRMWACACVLASLSEGFELY